MSPQRRGKALGLVVIAVAIGLIAGCTQSSTSAEPTPDHPRPADTGTGGGGTSAPPPAPGGFPVVADPAAVHLPIEAFMVSGAQAHADNLAVTLLTYKCLARLGFAPGPKLGEFSAADAEVSSLTARRYMLATDEVRTVGYHTSLTHAFVEQDLEHKQTMADAQAYYTTLGTGIDSLERAMSGLDANGNPLSDPSIPAGGCAGEANRALHGTDASLGWSDTVQQINRDSFDQSILDPRVVAAFAAWSACMAADGFTYATPIEANNDPQWATDKPSEREIATASADLECKTTTNLIGIWFGVESEIQQRMIDEHAVELAAAKEELDAAMAKINDALAGAHE